MKSGDVVCSVGARTTVHTATTSANPVVARRTRPGCFSDFARLPITASVGATKTAPDWKALARRERRMLLVVSHMDWVGVLRRPPCPAAVLTHVIPQCLSADLGSALTFVRPRSQRCPARRVIPPIVFIASMDVCATIAVKDARRRRAPGTAFMQVFTTEQNSRSFWFRIILTLGMLLPSSPIVRPHHEASVKPDWVQRCRT